MGECTQAALTRVGAGAEIRRGNVNAVHERHVLEAAAKAWVQVFDSLVCRQ